MGKIHDFLRQALWMAVFVIPIPAGAFAVHSAASLLTGFASFALLAALVPVFYFTVQKAGFGAACGGRRGAVHLPVSLSASALFLLFSWFWLTEEEALWKSAGMIPVTALAVCVMAAVVVLMLALDYAFLRVYDCIRGEKKRAWLALSFLLGLIPGTLLLSLLALSLSGIDRGAVFFLFITTGLTWVLFLKIILAMTGISLYLYFSVKGTRTRRMLQVFFTAVLWLILLYIPIVISLRLPAFGAWRTYFDPAYLSIAPFLSDLWLAGLAYLAGRKITDWIYSAADGN